TVLELLEQSPTAGTMPTMWPWRGWIEQASGDDAALAAVDVAKVRRLPATRTRAAPRPDLLRTLFNIPSQYMSRHSRRVCPSGRHDTGMEKTLSVICAQLCRTLINISAADLVKQLQSHQPQNSHASELSLVYEHLISSFDPYPGSFWPTGGGNRGFRSAVRVS